MLEKYTTIEEKVNGEIIEKKSKFIANIFPVENEEEALKYLEEVRKLHRDARHNVFVYRIANGSERASDDGEPSGTAGVPILDILRGMKLQNILVVVTRYFGGILLGTGGLVRAYTDSTKEALKLAKLKEKVLKIEYKIEIPYSYYDKISHFCRTNNYQIVNSDYSDAVSIFVVVERERAQDFETKITENSDRNAIIKIERDSYYA
ncbi:MAG: YigZ family protein [Clostridia bacterium]|nr:YigZ family protein [Clostridia bacterium]